MSGDAIFWCVYFGVGLICAVWVTLRRGEKLEENFLWWLVFEPWLLLVILFLWPVWMCAERVLDSKVGTAAASIAPITWDHPMAKPKEYLTETIMEETCTVVVELRPTGRVKIGGVLFEARCEGGVIPAGAKVVLTGRRMGELTVKSAVGVGTSGKTPSA